MANIDVQKKKSNPIVWIILVILILAVAGYFVWRNMNNTAATGAGTTDSTQVNTDTTRN
jgi:flagellar basal body-associated protein FliL